MASIIPQDRLLMGFAALAGTLGGFPKPPERVANWLKHPLAGFVQAFIWVWVVLQNTEQALMIALGWVLVLTLLQHKQFDDGRVPAERGNHTSTDISGDGGIVRHDF